MYSQIRKDAEMKRLEKIIENGDVTKRLAIAEMLEPGLKIPAKRGDKKKKR